MATVTLSIRALPFYRSSSYNAPIKSTSGQWVYLYVTVSGTSTVYSGTGDIDLRVAYSNDNSTWTTFANQNIGVPYSQATAYFVGQFSTLTSSSSTIYFKAYIQSSSHTATEKTCSYTTYDKTTPMLSSYTEDTQHRRMRISLSNVPRCGEIRVYRTVDNKKELIKIVEKTGSSTSLSFDDNFYMIGKQAKYDFECWNYITDDLDNRLSERFSTKISTLSNVSVESTYAFDGLLFQSLTGENAPINVEHFSRNYSKEIESAEYETFKSVGSEERYPKSSADNRINQKYSLTLYAYNKSEAENIARLYDESLIFRVYGLEEAPFVGHLQPSQNSWNLKRDNKYFSTYTCSVERISGVV